jgi:long-chain acyl-CoA synthetase
MTLAPPPITGPGAVPAALLAESHAAATWLAGRGVGHGSRVAVDAPDPLPWFLGADLLGASCLVVEPTWTPRERDAVLADARPALTVTGPVPAAVSLPEAAPSPAAAPVPAAAPAPEAVPLPEAAPGPAAAPVPAAVSVPAGGDETLFYLATTSGSSGRPKVLARTRGSWLRSFAALGPLPGPVLIPGPLSSSLFLFGALHGLWGGREVQCLRRWAPEAAAVAARRAATTHLVPSMLAGLLDVLERRPELRAACTLRAVVCGGAHLAPVTRDRFARLLPDAELIEYYGSAEHSLIAIRRGGDGLRPVPGLDLYVRDGLLWVRSPLAISGRLHHGVLQRVPEWTTAGDAVDTDDTGCLVVRGRAGTMVSCGGRLVSAEEVEAVLRTVPGVGDVVVAGTPHPTLGEIVTAVIEIGGDDPPALRALRAAVRAHLSPVKRPRRWLATKALPRTASGKPARATITAHLRTGTLPAEPLRRSEARR